jgi:hypothetical protein
MRKALVIGIDHYDHIPSLFGCVNDAYAVKSVLERNSDGTVNFAVKHIIGNASSKEATRATLKRDVIELFNGDSEIALLFFAGHGHIEATGGYLCGSDCQTGDDGISLNEIVLLANKSDAKNKIIVLDSCHSGIAGSAPLLNGVAELTEGLTILTASTASQYAQEINGSGVFTTLFVDALNGAAGNLLGSVTPGSVYAHIDQSLGPWDQRPMFKTNVKSFVSLRTVQSPVSPAELRQLVEFFPAGGAEYPLNPSYEPESGASDSGNTEIFSILQKFNRVNLVAPVGAPHMYHAAMENKSCKLTALGEHYRRLVERKLI